MRRGAEQAGVQIAMTQTEQLTMWLLLQDCGINVLLLVLLSLDSNAQFNSPAGDKVSW
jgi:hypothetical protein